MWRIWIMLKKSNLSRSVLFSGKRTKVNQKLKPSAKEPFEINEKLTSDILTEIYSVSD